MSQLFSSNYAFNFPSLASNSTDESNSNAASVIPPQPPPQKLKKAADEEDAINCLEKLRASTNELQVPTSLLGSSSNLAAISSLLLPVAPHQPSSTSSSALLSVSNGNALTNSTIMAGLPSLSNQQLSDVVPGIGTAIGNGTGTHQSPASLIFAQVPEIPGDEYQGSASGAGQQQDRAADIRNFPCTKCTRVCRTKSSLATHVQRKHGDQRENVCPVCQKSYAIKDSLQKHINRKHGGASSTTHGKFFPCSAPMCGKKFPTQKELADHISRHSKEKTFVCGINACEQAYTTKNSLNLHRARSHTAPKYMCGVCGERYAVRGDLNQHEKRKHNIDRPKSAPVTERSPGVGGGLEVASSSISDLLVSQQSHMAELKNSNVPSVIHHHNASTPSLPGISMITDSTFGGVFSPSQPPLMQLDDSNYDVAVLPSSPNPIGLSQT